MKLYVDNLVNRGYNRLFNQAELESDMEHLIYSVNRITILKR